MFLRIVLSQIKNLKMLSTHQQAPLFIVKDVFENIVRLEDLRGKKVYVAFERNAGCPVCNLRVHTLMKHADSFAQNNIVVLLVYESTEAKMQEYLDGKSYPFHFIADPDNKLYKTYGVGQSFAKLIKSLFNGLVSKAIEGKKLFSKSIAQDGHTATIPAEFMIDELGDLSIVHYGRFIGDHLPIPTILK
jgi:thioredoxin-dependent peroxiredoxin